MIFFNEFDTAKGKMIAMCDEELMGKVLKEGKIEINLKQYGGFYKGDLLTEDDVKSKINKSVYSANVVGNRSVKILKDAGLIKDADVRSVQGVKYVHLFRIMK
ncbi:MAG: DUF424 family protein [Candidatus Micrarchaeota archaeon]|nr:DUF424 family protein [Candidatus Micrarchaeota archaeon]MDE1834253.1 DUF424 family protein [Candidatus Micrarchaeota archaeon]MDE1858919.1 DUF424 family protein [Candidatus Micrarchaeota archaeon]